MPLDKNFAETVINDLRSMDVDTKLKAIERAQEMYSSTFEGQMTAGEYAYSAMTIETLYNLIRDELRTSYTKFVPKDLNDSISTVSSKKSSGASKTKKAKSSPKLSNNELADAMRQIMGLGPKKEEESSLFKESSNGELKT